MSDAEKETVSTAAGPYTRPTYEDIAFLAELNKAFFGNLNERAITSAVVPMLRRIGWIQPTARCRYQPESRRDDYGHGHGAEILIGISLAPSSGFDRRADLLRRLANLYLEANRLREHGAASGIAGVMATCANSESGDGDNVLPEPITVSVNVTVLRAHGDSGLAKFTCDDRCVEVQLGNAASFGKAVDALADAIRARVTKLV